MTTSRIHVRALTLLSLAALCSCSSHRSAGAMQVHAGRPVQLLLEAPDPIDVQVEIWSKGPSEVTWRGLTGTTTATGVLRPHGREATWNATTTKLQVELTVAEEHADVRYTVRSNRGFSLSMGER